MATLIDHAGNLFDPTDPTTLDFSIPYLARVLSRIPRWGGHTTPRWSVASHSVLVAYLVPPWLRLPALLHDAHEAYTGFGDVAAPVKPAALLELEAKIDEAVGAAYGFDHRLFYHPRLQAADRIARAIELRHLFPSTPATAQLSAALDPDHTPSPIPLEITSPTADQFRFAALLHTYNTERAASETPNHTESATP